MTKIDLQERRKGERRPVRLGLAKQLAILALVPALIAVGFMTATLFRELNARNQAKYVSNIIEYMVNASLLTHELQKERGASSGFIGSGGERMISELSEQRLLTDKKYTALREYLESLDLEQYGQKFAIQSTGYLKELRELPSIRERITSLSITVDQSITFFSGVISSILRSFQDANVSIKDSELSFPFTACIHFIMAKEMAGIERAIMVGIVAEDKSITAKSLQEWMRVCKGQEALFSAFEHQTSERILKEFRVKSSETKSKYLGDIRDIIIEKLGEGKFGLKPEYVFATATERINELKKIEDMQTYEIIKSAEKLYTKKNRSLIIYITLICISIMLMFFLCFLIARSITSPIAILLGAVRRVARGQFDNEIEIKSENEIGVLAGNFNNMLHNLRMMKEKNDIDNWLRTGQAELSIKMQGTRNIASLSDAIISYLTTYLEAQVGVLYVTEEDYVLKLVGSYAYTNPENRVEEFEFGEGLVGQAAQEKKTILVTNVPDDYIKVDTGWGESVPRNILVVPFLYKGIVKGVIELGSCNEFTDIQTDFLNMVAENIAAVFNLEQSRFKMREILDERVTNRLKS